MDAETRSVRSRIREAQRGRSALARRYPKELRGSIVDCARRRQASGDRLTRVARELGVSYRMLSAWLDSESASPTLRPVRVISEAESIGALSVSLRGLRVDGLTIDDLIVLTRALA